MNKFQLIYVKQSMSWHFFYKIPFIVEKKEFRGYSDCNNYNYDYTLFYKQNFYKQRQAEISKKSSSC